YWARSHVGWRHVADARPNAGHVALAQLERFGLVDGVVTQNVDGLHLAAGSRSVVELHGNLSRVQCTGCGELSSRAELDARLRAANPMFTGRAGVAAAEVNPDGDVSLDDALLSEFVMVGCQVCDDEFIEPDVVFFGATVLRDRVALAADLVDGARLLLVLGSSLQVMSGYRLVLRACERGIPVAIVNQGPTRGDSRAAVRVSAQLGAALPELARRTVGWSPAV
nr:Sir2 family NAD-dependent protein deacetylase [Micromonospora sp. DSM 115978]